MTPLAEIQSGGSKVLIVDDDRGLRALIERSLRGLGLVASQADCGQAALSWLRENDADLIVLDLRLPDMDAGQLIEMVTGEGMQTDFVIITGYGDERVAVEMMKRGARDYLMKDEVFLDRLPKVVDQVLRELSRERRLHEAEQALHLLEMAVRHMTDAVIVVSGTGSGLQNKVAYSNPAVRVLTGVEPDQFLGRPLAELLVGQECERARSHIERSLAGEHASNARANFSHRSGRIFPVDINVAPVRDKTGAITHHVILLRDITEQERLEQKSLNAQRLEALGQLAGGVAHDFNNVLTVTLGHAELLMLDLERNPQSAGSIKQIQHAAAHASALTTQLLSFSRQQSLQARVFDLSEKIARTHQMIERVIGDNIEFVTNYCNGPLLVSMDPAQVEQVLMNLVINSRDAMPNGGCIHVSTERQAGDSRPSSSGAPGDDELEFAVIRVRDEGTGISAETQARIFEPFYTTKSIDTGGGTGLGLATVYGIVSKAGGWIEVDSELEKGATFCVYLPIETGSGVADADQAIEPNRPPTGSEAVLVVEDDEAVGDLIVGALVALGYSVSIAHSPNEALQVAPQGLAGKPFELLVSDVVMPDGGGLQLVEMLHEQGIRPKILFISGFARGQLTPADLRHFNAGFLRKPFTPSELAIAIRQILDRD